MDKQEQGDRIIRTHVLWSMGAGLIPLPLFDLAAVTGIQMGMLEELTRLYGGSYTGATAKRFVTALTGSTFAKVAASLVKTLPGVGTLLGGLSMSAMSGASTYAVGQVAVQQLSADNAADLDDVDMDAAKSVYREAFEKGKNFVSGLDADKKAAKESFEKLEQLGKLREQGVLTEEEFQEKKRELLDKI